MEDSRLTPKSFSLKPRLYQSWMKTVRLISTEFKIDITCLQPPFVRFPVEEVNSKQSNAVRPDKNSRTPAVLTLGYLRVEATQKFRICTPCIEVQTMLNQSPSLFLRSSHRSTIFHVVHVYFGLRLFFFSLGLQSLLSNDEKQDGEHNEEQSMQ